MSPLIPVCKTHAEVESLKWYVYISQACLANVTSKTYLLLHMLQSKILNST